MEILRQNLPIYPKLTADDQFELQGYSLVFLNEKAFEGCGGLEINDEIRLTIAAQACLLLLRREPAYYPTLRTILGYAPSRLCPSPVLALPYYYPMNRGDRQGWLISGVMVFTIQDRVISFSRGSGVGNCKRSPGFMRLVGRYRRY